jgi:hypothetical protein
MAARSEYGGRVGLRPRTWATRVPGAALASIRAHPLVFLGVAASVLALNLVLPPFVLSVVRKPFDFFSLNPWLHNIPSWVRTADKPAGEKIAFLWNMALLWFVASGQYDAAEWGFTVTTSDVVRWILMGMLFGSYFTLWIARRAQLRTCRLPGASTRGGVAGAVLSTLGFTTMPCSVAGCGAPVLPVLGLALTGLSSGTISLLSTSSRLLIWVVLLGTAASVVVMSWQVSGGAPEAAAGKAAPARQARPG